ncbi:MAG: preprotein translocase subunit SecY [bacterium]|nr:preprotein translocase subunit SecY [bacterium]
MFTTFFGNIRNVFKIPELRRRVLITIALILVYRIGRHIPTPGVNAAALTEFFTAQKGTLFGMMDMFSGGNMSRATIFALGIMPYISSSIIFQLLVTVIPYLEKLSKEGDAGRKKITQYTRYGTVILSVVQGSAISLWLENMPLQYNVVPEPGWWFRIMTVVTLTAGTAFIMWLGEKITEHGIGNGISLIIFAGIVARTPTDTIKTITSLINGEMNIFVFVAIGVIMVAVTAAVVFMQGGQRRIRVQYAKRIKGRKVYGGQSTHIPLRVNTAGVIPVIFASSIIMFPQTILGFIGGSDAGILKQIADLLLPGEILYILLDITLILFFTYFYTAVVLNPQDMAENMKKYGGYIPGIRPGKPTAEFIDRSLTRITLAGGLFLAAIDIMPTVMMKYMNVPFYFGGTALLIVVGVALDTMRQVESHLLMRHYDGFVKKGRIRGRV